MPKLPPSIRPPSADEVQEFADKHFIHLTNEEIEAFTEAAKETIKIQEHVDGLKQPQEELKYTDRTPGYNPGPDEDPLNAFATKCKISGADSGLLSGYSIGVKDIIPVAGVEMTRGSKAFGKFIPSTDSTIITRILDAGGTITGKLNTTELGLTPLGAATGPVLNPHDPERFAGASSAGPAAAVVTGDVDISIGTDGGGSVRNPAAWCGCVGYNPTHGLLPGSSTSTTSNTGPLAKSVKECAIALDAMSANEPHDSSAPKIDTKYSEISAKDIDELQIGVLEEGFGHEFTDKGVDETVRAAIDKLEDAGATVQTISVPSHYDAPFVQQAILIEGIAASYQSESGGHFSWGPYNLQMMENFAQGRRTHADDFPPRLKYVLVLGQYLAEKHHGIYHAKAQNLRHEIYNAYYEPLTEVDVLALPTSAKVAERIEDIASQSLQQYLELGNKPTRTFNTKPFNLTGQPAISVPCGTVEDLPVGLMFAGKRYEDGTVLEAAATFEETVGWTNL